MILIKAKKQEISCESEEEVTGNHKLPCVLGGSQGFKWELSLPSCDNDTSCSSHVSYFVCVCLSILIYHGSNILSLQKLLLVCLISIQPVRKESDLFLTNFPSSVQQEPMKYCAINKNVESSKGLILWLKRINFTKSKLVMILIVVTIPSLAQYPIKTFSMF